MELGLEARLLRLEAEDDAWDIGPGHGGSRVVPSSSALLRTEELSTTVVMEALFEAGVGIEMGVDRRGRRAARGARILVQPESSNFGTAKTAPPRSDWSRRSMAPSTGLTSRPRGCSTATGSSCSAPNGCGPQGPRHSHRPRGHAAGAEGERTAQRAARPRRLRVGSRHRLDTR